MVSQRQNINKGLLTTSAESNVQPMNEGFCESQKTCSNNDQSKSSDEIQSPDSLIVDSEVSLDGFRLFQDPYFDDSVNENDRNNITPNHKTSLPEDFNCKSGSQSEQEKVLETPPTTCLQINYDFQIIVNQLMGLHAKMDEINIENATFRQQLSEQIKDLQEAQAITENNLAVKIEKEIGIASETIKSDLIIKIDELNTSINLINLDRVEIKKKIDNNSGKILQLKQNMTAVNEKIVEGRMEFSSLGAIVKRVKTENMAKAAVIIKKCEKLRKETKSEVLSIKNILHSLETTSVSEVAKINKAAEEDKLLILELWDKKESEIKRVSEKQRVEIHNQSGEIKRIKEVLFSDASGATCLTAEVEKLVEQNNKFREVINQQNDKISECTKESSNMLDFFGQKVKYIEENLEYVWEDMQGYHGSPSPSRAASPPPFAPVINLVDTENQQYQLGYPDIFNQNTNIFENVDQDGYYRPSYEREQHRRQNSWQNYVAKHKPMFSGSNKTIVYFLKELREFMTRTNMNEQDLVRLFPYLLFGQAKDWWDILEPQPTNLKEIIYKLENYYNDDYYKNRLKQEWQELELKNGSDIETFVIKAIKIQKALRKEESHKKRFERVILKMPRFLRDYMLTKDMETDEAFIKRAKEAVRLKGYDNQTSHKGPERNGYRNRKSYNSYSPYGNRPQNSKYYRGSKYYENSYYKNSRYNDSNNDTESNYDDKYDQRNCDKGYNKGRNYNRDNYQNTDNKRYSSSRHSPQNSYHQRQSNRSYYGDNKYVPHGDANKDKSNRSWKDRQQAKDQNSSKGKSVNQVSFWKPDGGHFQRDGHIFRGSTDYMAYCQLKKLENEAKNASNSPTQQGNP